MDMTEALATLDTYGCVENAEQCGYGDTYRIAWKEIINATDALASTSPDDTERFLDQLVN